MQNSKTAKFGAVIEDDNESDSEYSTERKPKTPA
jgi:hypothetical protein